MLKRFWKWLFYDGPTRVEEVLEARISELKDELEHARIQAAFQKRRASVATARLRKFKTRLSTNREPADLSSVVIPSMMKVKAQRRARLEAASLERARKAKDVPPEVSEKAAYWKKEISQADKVIADTDNLLRELENLESSNEKVQ